MIATLPALRLCLTCGATKPLTAFSYNGGLCRRRSCRLCVTIGATDYQRRAWQARRQVRAQHRAQREMPEASFETELAIICACWADCVAEGRPAIERMLLRLREVAELADVLVGRRVVAIATDYAVGRVSLGEAYRSLAAMGDGARG